MEPEFVKLIIKEATEAGLAAGNACVPTPMVVEAHQNMLDDNSPVVYREVVDDGVCGFAWINFVANTPINKEFLKGLKLAKLVWTCKYQGPPPQDRRDYPFQSRIEGPGFQHWVSMNTQSMQRKEAYAEAYAAVLKKYGINCYVGSRLD